MNFQSSKCEGLLTSQTI